MIEGLGSHPMEATIELPKAFSVRDDCELLPIRDLMARLNPALLVIQVATGCILTAATRSTGAWFTWMASG